MVEGWGKSVDISADGTQIVIGAPDVNQISFDRITWSTLVQVMHHRSQVSDSWILDEYPGHTWIPIFHVIKTSLSRKRFGSYVTFSGQNGILVQEEINLYWYEYNAGEWR